MPTPNPSLQAAALALFIPLTLLSCATPADPPPDTDPNNGAFVTMLGDDTLAVEQFERTPAKMTAQVVLRTPAATKREYVLELDETGALERYLTIISDPSSPADTSVLSVAHTTLAGDSLITVITEGGEENPTVTRLATAAHGGVLPFLDMIRWPFELMLTRARASGGRRSLCGKPVAPCAPCPYNTIFNAATHTHRSSVSIRAVTDIFRHGNQKVPHGR